MKRPLKKPDIFSYHGYREFLRDWFPYLRSLGRENSMRKIASRLDVSCAYLPSVLAGKRRLPEKFLPSLARELKLLPREVAFFERLVRSSDANSYQERANALEQVTQAKAYRKSNPKESEVFRYLTKWYFVVMREMADLTGFLPQLEWIRERMIAPVSSREIETGIQFLCENGFINKDNNRPAEKEIRCVGSVFKTALRKFHHEMIHLVLKNIDVTPVERHFITGYTFAISDSQFVSVKSILQDALRKIEQLGNTTDTKENIYHIEVLFAPLTQNATSKKESL